MGCHRRWCVSVCQCCAFLSCGLSCSCWHLRCAGVKGASSNAYWALWAPLEVGGDGEPTIGVGVMEKEWGPTCSCCVCACGQMLSTLLPSRDTDMRALYLPGLLVDWLKLSTYACAWWFTHTGQFWWSFIEGCKVPAWGPWLGSWGKFEKSPPLWA